MWKSSRTFGTSFITPKTNGVVFFTLTQASDGIADHVLQFRIARKFARRAQILALLYKKDRNDSYKSLYLGELSIRNLILKIIKEARLNQLKVVN